MKWTQDEDVSKNKECGRRSLAHGFKEVLQIKAGFLLKVW